MTTMIKAKIKTTTYHVNHEPGFYVDIVKTDKMFRAWLYHEEYSIKEYMFGMFAKDLDGEEDFIEIVQANLDNRLYVPNYREQYMTE